MTDIRYLAGFFDAEGCIGIYRQKGSPNPRYKSGFKSPCWIRVVAVTNTYYPVLQSYKTRFGGWIHELKNAARNKKCWAWTISSKSDIDFCLNTLLPDLSEKKPQAKLMLSAINNAALEQGIAIRLKEAKHAQLF